MITESLKVFPKIDCLVNNAGISQVGLFTDATIDDWNLMINTNLTSVFTTCKNIIPHMLHYHKGKIINISSMWGQVGASCEVHYSAAKAGLIGLTKSLARELASRNVTVNAVAPGFIETDMTAALPEAVRTEMAKDIPAGRAGQPEDVANAVAFFAAEQSSYLTGQVLCVDGGMAM